MFAHKMSVQICCNVVAVVGGGAAGVFIGGVGGDVFVVIAAID